MKEISKDHAIPVANDSVRCFHLFSQFQIFSCDTEIKQSSRDPLPTHILKNHLDARGRVKTAIVNESLTSGEFPPSLKRGSLTRPVLKKPNLDKDVLKNYRPVAIITFLAKSLRRLWRFRHISYLEKNLLMPVLKYCFL